MTQSIRERFDSKWIPEPNTGCWLWTAALTEAGYGTFCAKGQRTKRAHRHAWMLYRGPIPDGMVIDHICRVRSCVNPDHLRVATARENALENSEGLAAANIRKTMCSAGHALTGDNLFTYRMKKTGGIARVCRKCKQEWTRTKGVPAPLEVRRAWDRLYQIRKANKTTRPRRHPAIRAALPPSHAGETP